MAYSDEQVQQALRESMAQGFSLEDSIRGAMEKYGVQQDQLTRAKTAIQPADTVATLQNAGLKEHGPLNIGKPQDLARSLMSNPDLMQNLAASRQQAFDLGEASTYVDPGLEFGGYTFRQTPGASDFSGVYTPGGFTAIKKDTAPTGGMFDQLGVAGKPVETTYTYDNEGNVTGSEQRFFKGGDSGIVVRYDASGNPLDARPFDYSESWKGDVLPIANIALMAATAGLGAPLQTALQPALGQFGAQVASQALLGAGRGAVLGGLTGQDVGSSAFKGAVAGGASPLIGAAGELAGKAVGNFAGSILPQGAVGDFLQTLSGDVAKDIVRQVGGSAVGSLLTGRNFDLGSAVAGGALSGLTNTVFNEVKDNPAIKALPKELQGAALAALSAQLRGRDPGPAAVNALVGSVVQQIGRDIKTGSRTTGGGSFESGASGIWEGWDPSGGEGIYTGDESVLIPGSRDTGTEDTIDLVSDVLTPKTTPKITLPTQTVGVTGSKLATGDQFLDELLADVFPATTAGQTVDVTGKRLPGESVVVAGSKLPGEPTGGGTGTKTAGESVSVTGSRIPTDVVTTEAPTQTVGVTSTKLPSETVQITEKKETPPTTTTKTTTPTAPIIKPKEEDVAVSPFRMIPEQAMPQILKPGLADVFYGGAVEFGPEAASMADPTDFQGRKAQARRAMELALEGEGGENQADDAYERLMSLAQESPAATIEELMQIIGRD